MFFSRKKHSPSNSASPDINGPASQSQATNTQQLQVSTKSQSQLHSQSPQPNQQSQVVYPWSTHTPPFGPSPSPFPRNGHTLSMVSTIAGELLLFGGYVHSSKSTSNDLYVFSTRDFSTTLLRTSGETPSPRAGHAVALTKTDLLIWGGMRRLNGEYKGSDDSLYLLNLGTSHHLMLRSAPADQIFFRPSIAKVDPCRGQWSQAWQSLLSYDDNGWFQALHLRRSERQDIVQRYMGIF